MDASLPDTPRADSLVLVFGASGYIGTNLVPALLAAGRRVRASARNRAVLEGRGWRGVDVAEADALRPETLPAALAGVEVAYYLVHSMGAGRSFPALERQAAEHFRAAAAAAGVQRVVYLGGVVPPDPRSAHLRSRLETGDRLRAGPVPVTEVRAGIIVGPGSAAFEVIRDLVNHLPVMVTPRWVRSRASPIALENLLEYLVRLPWLPGTGGKVFDVGGPEVLTYEAIMRQYGEEVGRHPWIVPVPVLTPRLSSYWLKLVTAVPTNVARALIDGLSQDVLVDDAPARALVPQRLLTFREAVRATLEAERRDAVSARWVEGSLACRAWHPEYAFYAKRVTASAPTSATPEAIWRQITAIGGDTGYYYLDLLWRVRGVLDWLVGGPGLRRGRRHPTDLRVGDTLDAFRVIGVDPGARLTLLFEMKTPGSGVVEMEVAGQSGRSRVTVTGYFHPAGVWGLLYWYALLPAHALLFRGLARAIARRAEADREVATARGPAGT
jgi:uncharacterized protein YbjT (DUF2867 family)